MDLENIGAVFKNTFERPFDKSELLKHVDVQLEQRIDVFYAGLISHLSIEKLIALKASLHEKKTDPNTGHLKEKPWDRGAGTSGKSRK
jgi:hypothetical protein